MHLAPRSRGQGNVTLIPLENVSEISKLGINERAEQTVRAAFEAGRIGEATLRGTLAGRESGNGKTQQRESRPQRTGVRGQSQPQRDGPQPLTPPPVPPTATTPSVNPNADGTKRFDKKTLFTQDKVPGFFFSRILNR